MDEEIAYQDPGLALRKQAIEDEVARLEAILDTLDHTQFSRVEKTVAHIEALRDELDAIEDLETIEGQLALSG